RRPCSGVLWRFAEDRLDGSRRRYIPCWSTCDSVMLAFMLLAHCHATPARPNSWSSTYRLHHATRGPEHPESERGLHLDQLKEAIEVVPRASVCCQIGMGDGN